MLIILSGCTSKKEEKVADQPIKIESSKKISQERKFDYKPEKPSNGKLYATIEIGSSGLNYFIVNMDAQNRWELIKSGFGESALIDGEVDTDAIFLKIESYKRSIIKAGVSKNNIYVIASSSAIELRKIQEIKSRLSISGIKLRRINAMQEGYYDLIATIPKEFIEESFLVDIGSGSTKITWISSVDTTSLETLGSKYYLNEIQDTTVFRTVRDILIRIPETNRNLCFLLGGIPYEFAAATNKKKGRYTLLEAPSKYSPSTLKGKSGKIIYDAIHLNPTFSYIFDWDANFSIGYLMNMENR
ncbi:MAG: hypothetical protein AB8B73_09230 [Ekhidna sp.]